MSQDLEMRSLSAAKQELLVSLLSEQGVHLALHTDRAANLQDHLRELVDQRLPEHMRPRSITVLSAFPLTGNGKVDLAALPAPDMSTGRTIVPPRTETEAQLLELWRARLGDQEIGVDDDFFLMGGDSILATELATSINARFQTELPISLIFASPTIAQLAESIDLVLEMADPELNQLGLELPISKLTPDIQLDPSIHPPAGSVALPPDRWRALLLTGATGYFGSHLLASLLERTEATIFCLVRAPSPEAGLKRVLDAVRKYSPHSTVDAERLVAVPGDLAAHGFGLSPERFSALSARVDAVFHAGAIVNFSYHLDSLRGANIGGAQEVFRFAAASRVKPVHYISTINIFSSTHFVSDQRILETQPLLELPTVTGGYAQSRWVAEGIAQLARERGVPVTIYRPSIIGGHTKTGISNENDAVYRLFQGCIQLGCAPRLSSRLNIVTADFAAGAATTLALEPANVGRTFHLVNPQPSPLAELFDSLRAHGYPLQAVTYREWHERIEAAGPQNALYPLLTIIGHLGVTDAIGIRPPHFDDSQACEALRASGITCPPIDDALITLFLDAMVQHGSIPRPQ